MNNQTLSRKVETCFNYCRNREYAECWMCHYEFEATKQELENIKAKGEHPLCRLCTRIMENRKQGKEDFYA